MSRDTRIEFHAMPASDSRIESGKSGGCAGCGSAARTSSFTDPRIELPAVVPGIDTLFGHKNNKLHCKPSKVSLCGDPCPVGQARTMSVDSHCNRTFTPCFDFPMCAWDVPGATGGGGASTFITP